MKRRPPKTLRGWAAKDRRDMKAQIGAHVAAATDFRMEIARLKRSLRAAQERIAEFEWAHDQRKLQEQINWSDYDRAVDQTTAAETELFKASPAYQKYQEFRRARVQRDARPQFEGEEVTTVGADGRVIETKRSGVQGFNPLSGRTPP